MSTTDVGGILLIRSNGTQFANSKVGDVGLYTGAREKNLLAGPSNGHALPTLWATSSNMVVDNNMQITGNMMNNGGMICLTMGGPVGESLYADTSFSNAATFACGASMFGSSNLFMGLGEISGNTNFSSSNGVTIGGAHTNMYPLHVISTIRTLFQGKFKSTDISIYMKGDYVTLSDSNLKTDVRVIPNALAKVNSISGYTFSWINRPGSSRTAGVIAQEVQSVLPEAVVEDCHGELGVSYGNLCALIIQAVKELACRRHITTVTTSETDEQFSIDLPLLASGRWVAAVMSSSSDLQYSRKVATVSADGRSVVGRAERPGTYMVMVLAVR